MARLLAVTAVGALLLTGCAHRRQARRVPPPPARRAPPARSASIPVPIGTLETGIASWYGHPYHGRAAASGEIYDMEKLTAAHRTLPFNTWVRVYDLDTKKTIDLRINDRGPFVDGRIIDISHAAARAIDMIGPGVARVRIEVIQPAPSAPPAVFAVQVGAFRSRENADRVRAKMEEHFGRARLIERQGSQALWRVLVGAEPTEGAAGMLAERVRREVAGAAAFVVRAD